MFKSIYRPRTLSVSTALATALAVFSLLFATPVLADVDPVSCNSTGGAVVLITYRADGVTPVGSGTVADSETVKYKATLLGLPAPVCSYEGGTITITTPDGIVHDATPILGVPRVGGSGVSTVDSLLVSYTVNHANEVVNGTRHINASTNYSGGVTHKTLVDVPGSGPSLSTSDNVFVIHTPVVTTDIHTTSHTATTSIAIGSTVHDEAVVTGEVGGPVPTGTVTFDIFNSASCSGEPSSSVVGIPLDGSGVAESPTNIVPATGMAYLAHYNGDVNYSASDAQCEPLTAIKLKPTAVTTIHDAQEVAVTEVLVGTSVHDSATVTGSNGTPTGNIDFYFYSGEGCVAEIAPTPSTVPLIAGVAHPSASQIPVVAGSYSFLAHYNGDSTYSPVDADCEPLTVVAKGHLIVQKTTFPSQDVTVFPITASGNGTITGGGSGTISDATDMDYEVTPGTYSVSEDLTNLPTWQQVSSDCTDVTVAAGETKFCTIVNKKAAHIKVEKTSVGGIGQFDFTGDAGAFSLTTLSPDVPVSSFFDVFVSTGGQPISITETVPSGWDVNQVTCNLATVMPGATPTCSFTNTKRAHIIVDKMTAPSADLQSFDFTTTGDGYSAFSLTDAAAPNDQEVSPGTYTVAEEAIPGWASDGGVCDGEDNSPESITVAPGETVHCTFTNTKGGMIIVKKVMVGGTDSFDFTGSPAGSISVSGDTISAAVEPGTSYVSTETPKVGWNLTSVTCDDEDSVGSVGLGSASFHVSAGETVTCTFTNTKQKGHIIVDKITNPTEDPQIFSFTAGGVGYTNFTLTDADAPNDQELDAGTYSVSEGAVLGWVSNGGVCDNDQTPGNITLLAGQTIHCTFTNTYVPQTGSLVIVKNANGGDATFNFTVSGPSASTPAITTVANTGTTGSIVVGTGAYAVSENPLAGWTQNGAVCVSSNVDDVETAANINISVGETVTCTFTNTKIVEQVNGSISGFKWDDLATVSSCKEDDDDEHDGDDDHGHKSKGFTQIHSGIHYDNDDECEHDHVGVQGTGNGIFDVGETKLAGWTMFIDLDADKTLDVGETSTITDANGNYTFGNLPAGTYSICEVMQSGWAQTYPGTGAGTCHTVVLGASENAVDKNFGNSVVSIKDCKHGEHGSGHEDNDEHHGDEHHDNNEGGHGTPWHPPMQKGHIIIKKVTVGGDGTFTFVPNYDPIFVLSNGDKKDSGLLDPGNYMVTENPTPKWTLTSATCVSSKGDSEVPGNMNLQANETITCTFVNTKDKEKKNEHESHFSDKKKSNNSHGNH